jgi:hypothetical protein
MTIRARIDVDAVYHDSTSTSITVGSLADHLLVSPGAAQTIVASVGTAAVSISGPSSLSTLVVKNTGASVLRLGGSINITAGRVAVIPTTSTITVSSPSGSGSYSCLWVG